MDKQYFFKISCDNDILVWETCKASLARAKVKARLLAKDLGVEHGAIEICELHHVQQSDMFNRTFKTVVYESHF